MSIRKTNFIELLGELHGGVLINKINEALNQVTLGVCYSGAKKPTGKVVLEMTITPIGDTDQVLMSHTLALHCPTDRGKRTETDTTETPLHVASGGRLIAFPEQKTDDLFSSNNPHTQE